MVLRLNMAKPWAPSHISEVAKGMGIEKRISGDVKNTGRNVKFGIKKNY